MKDLAVEAEGRARGRGLYDEDFWGWTRQQAGALRRRDYGAIDWDNVIEEIETLGRREKRFWTSQCENVVSHLLKIQHDPESPDVRHWRDEIEDWRDQMHEALGENPSMRSELAELLAKAWKRGRRAAVKKLVEHARPESWSAEKRVRRGLELRLPSERPYHVEDVAGCDPYDKNAEPDPDVWPAQVARVLNARLGADYPVRERGPERGSRRGGGFSR